MAREATPVKEDDSNRQALRILRPRDVVAIDHALDEVGSFGEVHLVIEKGRLRYIRTVKSEALIGVPEVHTREGE